MLTKSPKHNICREKHLETEEYHRARNLDSAHSKPNEASNQYSQGLLISQ